MGRKNSSSKNAEAKRFDEMMEHALKLAESGQHEHVDTEKLWDEITFLVDKRTGELLREHCSIAADPWNANVWGLFLSSGECAAIYWRTLADVETGIAFDNLYTSK